MRKFPKTGEKRLSTDVAMIEEFGEVLKELWGEVGKRIVGQRKVLEGIIISSLSDGHSIIIGVPGLAKTLMVNTIAEVLDLKFQRIQFTPDLMPLDIIGTEILEEEKTTGKRRMRFVKGPVFANIILADEINRAPPKTQSALLQAMQEKNVTVSGITYTLEPPFTVLATQNPIEQEGTYPLPEAQLDRFMFSINITYPSFNEEVEIVKKTTSSYEPELKKVMQRADVIKFQKLVRRVPVSEELISYAVSIVNATRPEKTKVDFIKEWVRWGAGPRASQYLILGAKVKALLDGRIVPEKKDIRYAVPFVLRHRIILNFVAEAEGITPDDIVKRLLEIIE